MIFFYILYFMAEKSWPILYKNLVHKMGQDFLDLQYNHLYNN